MMALISKNSSLKFRFSSNYSARIGSRRTRKPKEYLAVIATTIGSIFLRGLSIGKWSNEINLLDGPLDKVTSRTKGSIDD